jgi:hypothetical protein
VPLTGLWHLSKLQPGARTKCVDSDSSRRRTTMPVETRSGRGLGRPGSTHGGLRVSRPGQDAQPGRPGRETSPPVVGTPWRATHNQTGFLSNQSQQVEISFGQQQDQRAGRRRSQIKQLGGAGGELPDDQLAAYVEDRSTFGDWQPSIAIGDPLWCPGEDLSKTQLANRKIAQWRAILEYHDGSPYIQERLDQAIRERLALDDGEENTLPM